MEMFERFGIQIGVAAGVMWVVLGTLNSMFDLDAAAEAFSYWVWP